MSKKTNYWTQYVDWVKAKIYPYVESIFKDLSAPDWLQGIVMFLIKLGIYLNIVIMPFAIAAVFMLAGTNILALVAVVLYAFAAYGFYTNLDAMLNAKPEGWDTLFALTILSGVVSLLTSNLYSVQGWVATIANLFLSLLLLWIVRPRFGLGAKSKKQEAK